MRIGIVGAGVAGAGLAEKLAGQGHQVLLFDHRAPWEKPCGGGLTPRALAEFPELLELSIPRHQVAELVLIGPGGRRVGLGMSQAWHTVSRQELGRALLERATSAGAKFYPVRVRRIIEAQGYQLETGAGNFPVDFLVGADGANGPTRQALAGKWPPGNLCLCYGFLLPRSGPVPLVIRFFPDMLGYAWLFPRPGNLFSSGIAASGSDLKREALVERLRRFTAEEFARSGQPVPDFPKPYAALLPSLSPAGFIGAKLGGKNWALIGDASGSVDPVTGEGMADAFQTARLLAEALAEDQGRSYPERWQEMARIQIGHAGTHSWRERFYRPWVLSLYSWLLHSSPQVREITQEIMTGRQKYLDLKPRILQAAPRIFLETLCSPLARKNRA